MNRFGKAMLGAAVATAALSSSAFAVGEDVVTLPSGLTPTGVATKLLTDNSAQIGGVIGIAFVATLVVAAIGIVRSRFGKKGGSVVK